MSVLSSLARPIHELLLRRLVVAHDVKALMVADRNGLSLVSTLASGTLEDSLAAYAGLVMSGARFARDELKLDGFQYVHVMGQARQVFVASLTLEEVLVAITEVTATPTNVITMLMGTAVEVMNLVANAHHAPSDEGDAYDIPMELDA